MSTDINSEFALYLIVFYVKYYLKNSITYTYSPNNGYMYHLSGYKDDYLPNNI